MTAGRAGAILLGWLLAVGVVVVLCAAWGMGLVGFFSVAWPR